MDRYSMHWNVWLPGLSTPIQYVLICDVPSRSRRKIGHGIGRQTSLNAAAHCELAIVAMFTTHHFFWSSFNPYRFCHALTKLSYFIQYDDWTSRHFDHLSAVYGGPIWYRIKVLFLVVMWCGRLSLSSKQYLMNYDPVESLSPISDITFEII